MIGYKPFYKTLFEKDITEHRRIFNQDETVDVSDVAHLAQYLAGWDVSLRSNDCPKLYFSGNMEDMNGKKDVSYDIPSSPACQDLFVKREEIFSLCKKRPLLFAECVIPKSGGGGYNRDVSSEIPCCMGKTVVLQ